jgi:hypothetical protein
MRRLSRGTRWRNAPHPLWISMSMVGVVIAAVLGGGSAGATSPGRVATSGAHAVLSVTVARTPQVESGESEVHAVVEVSGPSFAGKRVRISSSQLGVSCSGGISFETLEGGSVADPVKGSPLSVVLDSYGDATVIVGGSHCTPGSDVVEASLLPAPHASATTSLTIDPPAPTSAGITGFPASEVETTGASVYAVFYVGTSAVFAQDPIDVQSSQLQGDCTGGWRLEPGNGGTAIWGSDTASTAAQTTVDSDGNAAFVFEGRSCSPGTFSVSSELATPPHTTYQTSFTTVGLTPTITKLNPAKGTPGTAVTITGTNLLRAKVSFAGTSAVITADTATKITTVVPTGAASGTVAVSTSWGTATSPAPFTVT